MKCIPHKVILVATLLAVSSCGDTKEPTHTRMMGEPCNQIDNCEGGLFCENDL